MLFLWTPGDITTVSPVQMFRYKYQNCSVLTTQPNVPPSQWQLLLAAVTAYFIEE